MKKKKFKCSACALTTFVYSFVPEFIFYQQNYPTLMLMFSPNIIMESFTKRQRDAWRYKNSVTTRQRNVWRYKNSVTTHSKS